MAVKSQIQTKITHSGSGMLACSSPRRDPSERRPRCESHPDRPRFPPGKPERNVRLKVVPTDRKATGNAICAGHSRGGGGVLSIPDRCKSVKQRWQR